MSDPKEHRVWIGPDDEDPERSVWDCSCGAGGSAPEYLVDLASDKHIKPGEHRIDTNRRPR
jgi:hypothetical protein